MSLPPPDEPVLESAALAEEIAATVCTRTPVPCDWYHALYPYLRVLGLAATPERHAPFYDEVFRRLAGEGYARVAITGTADTCMLAHVLRAYHGAGVTPALTVVDRCATPLRLCAAYAERASIRLTTEVADMLAWRSARKFDVVTTHAFIGMFPPARQPDLLRRWLDALHPGGVLVSVARVDDQWSPSVPGFSATQAEAFRALVERRAVAAQGPRVPDRTTLDARVRRYTRTMRSFPFASEEALVRALEGAGFRIEQLDLVCFEGRAGAAESGPGAHRPGTFAHFVAAAPGVRRRGRETTG